MPYTRAKVREGERERKGVKSVQASSSSAQKYSVSRMGNSRAEEEFLNLIYIY